MTNRLLAACLGVSVCTLASAHGVGESTALPDVPIYRGIGTYVVSSPYFNISSEYDGSDLVVNTSSINKDISLLRHQGNFERELLTSGRPLPDHAIIEMGGLIEGHAEAARTFDDKDESDLNISGSELDFAVTIMPWVTGFMSINYDDGHGSSGSRIAHSNIFLDKAFVTFGDFERSPLYLTIGQQYVPFGQYDSFMISDSYAKTLGRTKGRALVVGYNDEDCNSLNFSAYAFRGDIKKGTFVTTPVEPHSDDINTWGANAYTKWPISDSVKTRWGVSYISSISEADGQQFTHGSDFRGFATTSNTEVLEHRVPGVDARTQWDFGDCFSLIGEYTGAARSYHASNLAHNADGARPQAAHIEGVAFFDIGHHPSSFALGYDHGWETLALGIPHNRYSATLNSIILQDTDLSFEFRRDEHYSNSDRGAANGVTAFAPPGRFENVLSAQLEVFF